MISSFARFRILRAALAVVAVSAIPSACESSGTSGKDSNTNWAQVCADDSQCGALRCLCGTCSRACENAGDCSGLPAAACESDVECAAAPSKCVATCAKTADCTGAGMACQGGRCVAARLTGADASVEGGEGDAAAAGGIGAGGGGGIGGAGGTDASVSSGGTPGAGGFVGTGNAGSVGSGGTGPGGFCNGDGICQSGKEQTGTCPDCPAGFAIVSAAPGGTPGTPRVIGEGDATTPIAVDDDTVYFGAAGALYSFDLATGTRGTMVSGLFSISSIAVDRAKSLSNRVVYVASPPPSPMTLRYANKTGGDVNLNVPAERVLTADDDYIFFTLNGDLQRGTYTPNAAGFTPPKPADGAGQAYAALQGSLFEVAPTGGDVQLVQMDEFSGAGSVVGFFPAFACSTSPCGALATPPPTFAQKLLAVGWGGQVYVWDGSSAPHRLDQATGPVATDGTNAYYASGGFIWKRGVGADAGPILQVAAGAPISMWVTARYLLWTVSSGAGTIQLEAEEL
ncbi:MAG TPA: hypothetical protein VHE30_06555 [Polyangiaceae bacterium]|nr:hypothetical protein [Polyangiaceae bacterium]